MPPPPRTQDLVEVGRVSKRGACFGEECLLLGETPRVTACTLSRCAIMRVSEAALGKSLRASPKLAERLALAVTTAERERAEAESQDMSVHVTVVRAKALPEEYNLEWGQSDPTVFLELEGQRARTLSQRNTRKHGQEPIFEESFVFDGVKHKSSFLRMSLCDVDRSGMYERVIGRCEIKVASLLERRQLKEDMTLSMPNKSDMHHFRDADDGNSSQGPELCLEASQRLFALKHVPRRKLHQSMVNSLKIPFLPFSLSPFLPFSLSPSPPPFPCALSLSLFLPPPFSLSFSLPLTLYFETSTLNPRPSTLNPQPSTLDPDLGPWNARLGEGGGRTAWKCVP
jgi:CRP-like cAMP-binding protein